MIIRSFRVNNGGKNKNNRKSSQRKVRNERRKHKVNL